MPKNITIGQEPYQRDLQELNWEAWDHHRMARLCQLLPFSQQCRLKVIKNRYTIFRWIMFLNLMLYIYLRN